MNKMVSKKGFTLIELLIVITIIGILSAALLPSILGAPARARDAGRKGDLNSIIAALETYNADNQTYPQDMICLEGGHISNDGSLDMYFQGGEAPQDPQTASMQAFTVGTGILNCKGYFYCPMDGNPANYLVGAYMEVWNDGNVKANDETLKAACTAGTGGVGTDIPAGTTFPAPDADTVTPLFVVVK